MLLEIENQLYSRVHSAIGQSGVVLRLAEELDQSGRVAEQTMIIVSYEGGNTTNKMNGGAYIPTVRERSMTYSLTIVQKQIQREGHSYALPLMDLIADAITGWVPEVPGLEFATGFELGAERFVQITDSSQFIYEQKYTTSVTISDGRFYTQPCAAFDPISIEDFLPKRSCLLTENGVNTGLAVWSRIISPEVTESYIVEDLRGCERRLGDRLSLSCGQAGDGSGTYIFTPKEAISIDNNGNEVINNSLVVQGNLSNVWKCDKSKSGDVPPWFKLDINFDLWRNKAGTVPNTDPESSSKHFSIKLKPDDEYLKSS